MSLLDDICARRRSSVARRRAAVPLHALPAPPTDVAPSLSASLRGVRDEGVAVIAEHKRRAPSSGPLGTPATLAEVVDGYTTAGASGLSVLTEAEHFDGSLADLDEARRHTALPLLRKDFTVDAYQLHEARAHGASAVLLIAAALTLEEARRFRELAGELGLEVLLELHDPSELDYLAIDPEVVGVNNRNLATMHVDLAAGEALFGQLPTHGPLRISESGIHGPADAARMLGAGYEALLIGTQFMRTPDPGAALADFLAGTRRLLAAQTEAP